MSICVPAKGGNMSNDLLLADNIGKKDACMSGIFLLDMWDGNKFLQKKHTEDFPNHEVREEAIYYHEKSDFSKHENNPNSVSVDKKYKDTVFRMLFKEKPEALSLYNALNDTHYTDCNKLEIVTLENAIYMNVKNDLAFLLDSTLNMYEHQSTYAVNMPLRSLIYVASEYQKLIDNRSMHSERPLKLPTPKFVVFYNGKKKRPEREILKLSDLYEIPSDNPQLELQVLVLNINQGCNEDLKKKCKTLHEYMLYIDKIRYYRNRKNMSLEEAVNQSITECLKEDILTDFLNKNRREIVGLSIFEYDEEKELELLKKDQFEYGRENGYNEAIVHIVLNCLNNGKSCEEIAAFNNIPVAKVQEIQKAILSI